MRLDTLVQGPENLRGPTENSPLGIMRSTDLEDDLQALSHAATKALKKRNISNCIKLILRD